jgi:hypothetical protein
MWRKRTRNEFTFQVAIFTVDYLLHPSGIDWRSIA